MEQAGSLLSHGTCHRSGQSHPKAMLVAFTCAGRQGSGCTSMRCRGGERGRGREAATALKTR